MVDQHATPLLSALAASAQRPHAAFYAPGHRRGQGAAPALRELLGEQALRADLPELPELDNLFAPAGVIAQAQTLAAEAFGAERSYFLANGSTCGLEAALLATCAPNEPVLVPRNAHRSVVAGLILSGAHPVYVAPTLDAAFAPGLPLAIDPATVATALARYPQARAVVLVSPTYHGVCSDGAAIAAVAHGHGIPLIVDEAHGPHFAFHPALPAPALALGADVVVQSTHKLLGALSQASMLHGQGQRVDWSRLAAALQLTQSTSPSALLLASLDAARHQMATAGEALLGPTVALARTLATELAALPGLAVVGQGAGPLPPTIAALDPTRLVVDVTGLGLSGLAADELLHGELGVTVELPELAHLTLMVSLGNTVADGEQCVAGFRTLAERAWAGYAADPVSAWAGAVLPIAPITCPAVSPRTAFFAPMATVAAADAVGKLSAETLSPYPPGIPVVVAGEEITAEALALVQQVRQQGGEVTGARDSTLGSLKILDL